MEMRSSVLGKVRSGASSFRVIGGGISGLLIAHRLTSHGHTVELYESSNRMGGLIETVRTSEGLAERAAHSILATPPVFELFMDLGVEWYEVRPESRARFIWRNGKARRLPLSILGLLRLLWGVLFKRSKGAEGQSLAQWGDEILGREAREYLLDPFVRGIYASTPDELSLSAAFPSLKIPAGKSFFTHRRNLAQIEKKAGDRASVRGKMIVPQAGMGSVVAALEESLRRSGLCQFHLNTEVTSEMMRAWTDPSSRTNVIITVPANSAANLLQDGIPELAKSLRQKVRYSPLLTATAFCSKEFGERRGVGLLVPSCEQVQSEEALGILFNSSSFAGRVTEPQRFQSFSMIFGGTQNRGVIHWSSTQVQAVVKSEVENRLGLGTSLQSVEWKAWEFAIPVYDAGLLEVWSDAVTNLEDQPGVLLFGNYTGEVSLRGMIEQSASFVKTLTNETVLSS